MSPPALIPSSRFCFCFFATEHSSKYLKGFWRQFLMHTRRYASRALMHWTRAHYGNYEHFNFFSIVSGGCCRLELSLRKNGEELRHKNHSLPRILCYCLKDVLSYMMAPSSAFIEICYALLVVYFLTTFPLSYFLNCCNDAEKSLRITTSTDEIELALLLTSHYTLSWVMLNLSNECDKGPLING